VNDRDAVYNAAADIAKAFAALTRGPQVQRAFESVRARAGVDLDRHAYLVVDTLDTQGPLRVGELADVCGFDISTISRLVARLQHRGLVTASPFEGDRRVVLLAATPAGVEQTRRVKQVRRDQLAAFLCAWTPEERETFARLLERFVTSLDASVDEAAMEQRR
jgi:DNA-binding MarR family transcriptional regulator